MKDFTGGTDLSGLDKGMTFSELTIEQGTGSYSSHPIVKKGSEYLAVVENMTASDLTESSFTPVDIDESGTMTASTAFILPLVDSGSDIDVMPVILDPTPGGFNQEEAISDYGIQLEGEYETITLPEEVDKIQIEEGQAKQDILDLHETNEILVDLPFEDDILVVSYDL